MSNGRILSIQSHVVHGYVGNKAAVFPLQVCPTQQILIVNLKTLHYDSFPKKSFSDSRSTLSTRFNSPTTPSTNVSRDSVSTRPNSATCTMASNKMTCCNTAICSPVGRFFYFFPSFFNNPTKKSKKWLAKLLKKKTKIKSTRLRWKPDFSQQASWHCGRAQGQKSQSCLP